MPRSVSELARNAAARRTPEERQAIHRKGVKERLRRLYTIPRTVTSIQIGYTAACRVTERIVPWFPHGSRKRKRPVFVRIELSVEEVERYRAEEEEA
jgi:hypothetical protein